VKNPAPIEKFTGLMKRFAHLSAEEIAQLQEYVDKSYAQVKRVVDCG
jgi:hypothetical protein